MCCILQGCSASIAALPPLPALPVSSAVRSLFVGLRVVGAKNLAPLAAGQTWFTNVLVDTPSNAVGHTHPSATAEWNHVVAFNGAADSTVRVLVHCSPRSELVGFADVPLRSLLHGGSEDISLFAAGGAGPDGPLPPVQTTATVQLRLAGICKSLAALEALGLPVRPDATEQAPG